MGTPGDRSRYKTISDSKAIQLEDHQPNDDNTTPTSSSSSSSSTATSIASSATTTTSMTVIAQLPHFNHSFTNIYNSNTVVKNEASSIGGGTLKQEPLEQTYIDDYYQEHKFSHSNLFKASPESKTSSIPADLEAAGPSGLQTPKSTSKTKTNVTAKKLKKPTMKKQYACPVCQKCFQNANKLAKHQQIHGSSSPFKCEHCKKSFSSKFKLVRHVLIHSDRKPFCCTICDRTFHRKDHLKNHIKVHSPCKKVHVCEKTTCKKEYTSLISYKKHLAFHAAEDGALDCLICEKSFKTKEEILYHLKVHAGSRTVKNPEEKKYSCDHCDRKFFTRKDVRRHMVVHTGRRDFLCQFCPQRFGRKDHLVRHIKKSHSKSDGGDNRIVSVVKSEMPDAISTAAGTGTMVVIKSEAEESNLSDPEHFPPNLDLESFLRQPHTQGEELTDLGCEVLDVIPDPMVAGGTSLDASVVSNASEDDLFEGNVLTLNDDSLMLTYLDEAPLLRETTPLPAFSQIFQQPPSQQPQQHQPPSPR